MVNKGDFKRNNFEKSTIYLISLLFLFFAGVQPLHGQSDPGSSPLFKAGQKWNYVSDGAHILSPGSGKKVNIFPSSKQLRGKRSRLFIPSTKNKINSEPVNSQWEKMPGPYGGTIRQFLNFNNTLYGVGERDIFVFENSTWESLQFEEIFGNNVTSFHLFESGRMLASSDYGVYHSENEGESWHRVEFFKFGTNIKAFYETDENGILLSTSDGIYKSNSSGTEFKLIALEGMPVNSITIDTEGSIWAATNTGVLKAEYGEFNWQWMNLDENYYLKMISDSDDVIYTFSRNKVWKSNDAGESWWMLEGPYFSDITLDSNGNLIIASMYQVISSQQETIQWVSQNSNSAITTAYPIAEQLILVGLLGSGVNKYNPESDTFSYFSNNGLNTSTVRSLAALGNGVLLASTDADSIYRSQDNGLNWTAVTDVWSMVMKSTKSGSVYAVKGSNLVKSVDFGKTWKDLLIEENSNFIESFDISEDEKTIFIGTVRGELYASFDSGENFVLTHEGPENYVNSIKIIGENTLVMAIDSLYFSDNRGYHFTAIDDSLIGSISDFAIDNLGYKYLSSSNGIFKSTFGLKWKLVSENFDNVDYLETDEYYNIYGALSDGSVYVSTNHGESWELIAEPIPNTFFWSFTVSRDEFIFYGSQDKGLFRHEIDIKKREIDKISISLNFPNPFRISTRIEYDVPVQTYVELTVYDLLGRKLETLVADHKNEGEHVVIWNADSYPSGIYLYRIRVGAETKTGKMTLIK